jgi:hypothetical protein
MKDYGHGFKVHDVAYLKMLECFAIISDKEDVETANSTSGTGIRKATKGEARKYRKDFFNGKKAY